jgi:ribonucleoside-diphosphate reductase alpha chain
MMTEEEVNAVLASCQKSVSGEVFAKLQAMAAQALMATKRPDVTEVRPQELECDVVRFQNNKEKWVALVGLLNGYPYEIFTGLQDDEEGIVLPKNLTKGKIIKQVNPDGTKRYDFQFVNKRGYKTTVEGLSEKFNPEYWNYAKLISGVLRYRMPLEHVIRLVASLSLKDESINTWKTGVERALKKYVPGSHDTEEQTEGLEG